MTEDLRTPSQQRTGLSRLLDLILLAFAIPAIACVAILTFIRAARAVPGTPWETAFVVDAWRYLDGAPMYSATHAPHMYGPLLSHTLGILSGVFGVHLQTGRIVSVVCGTIATVALMMVVRTRSAYVNFAIFALLLGINTRTGMYFADSRPDAAALLFGVLATILFYRGYVHGSRVSIAVGTAAMIVGFLFKQPTAMVALIPPLALWLADRRVRLNTLIPLAAFAATLVVLKLGAPLAFNAMVAVPGQYEIVPYRLVKVPLDFFATLPIFLIAIAATVVARVRDAADPWYGAAILVTVPLCTMVAAKQGGSLNALMFAYAAVLTFVASRAPHFMHVVSITSTRRAIALTVTIVVAAGLSIFAQPAFIIGPVQDTHGDRSYADAVRVVRNLAGRVVAPDDPTIPLFAHGFAGTQAHVEADAVGWRFPDRVLAELDSADFAVEVRHTWGAQWVTPEVLATAGFEPAPSELDGSTYKLWRKTRRPQ